MARVSCQTKSYYCPGDLTYHYKSDLPKSLQPYVDYLFSSGGCIGDDFKSFNTKFKSAVKKQLPEGFEIHSWNRGHYYCSAVIKTPSNNFIFMSIGDVRWCINEWFENILYRTMKNETDWTGGNNHYASLFNLGEAIKKLEEKQNA